MPKSTSKDTSKDTGHKEGPIHTPTTLAKNAKKKK